MYANSCFAITAKFLYNLTKNLTAHLRHYGFLEATLFKIWKIDNKKIRPANGFGCHLQGDFIFTVHRF